MKIHTISDIRSWNPCYNPSRHLPEDWSGTALDILQHSTIPDKDKIWLMTRESVMTDSGLRRFAVDCARRAQTYPKNYTPDPRTLKAIEVAALYAEGLATDKELAAAYTTAYAAACDCSYYMARAAAAAATTAACDCSYYAAATTAAYDAYAAASDDVVNLERRLQVEYFIRAAEGDHEKLRKCFNP